MSRTTRNALDAYQMVGVDAKAGGATPHELIAMLFEGAILSINAAKGMMERKEIPEKGAAISKAIAIIDEGLKMSLNEVEGGELAQNLKALYEYMVMRLLHANLNNDTAALDEVAKLLGELKAAWDEIGKRPVSDSTGESTEVSQRV